MSELSKLNQKLNIKKIDKETVNIKILDNNILLSIVGEFNANLVELEKLTDTTLFFRCSNKVFSFSFPLERDY